MACPPCRHAWKVPEAGEDDLIQVGGKWREPESKQSRERRERRERPGSWWSRLVYERKSK